MLVVLDLRYFQHCCIGMVGLAPKWVRLATKGTNPGLFQIRFQYIWRGAPNALKSDLKKPRICPIWGQSDQLWSQTYHPGDDLHVWKHSVYIRVCWLTQYNIVYIHICLDIYLSTKTLCNIFTYTVCRYRRVYTHDALGCLHT